MQASKESQKTKLLYETSKVVYEKKNEHRKDNNESVVLIFMVNLNKYIFGNTFEFEHFAIIIIIIIIQHQVRYCKHF